MIRKTKPFARTLTALSACVISLFASPVLAEGFASPSGNIVCYAELDGGMSAARAPLVCLIFEANWDVEVDDDPSCNLDRTRAISLPRNGAPTEHLMCHGDVFWPAPLGAISYGSEWSFVDFTCSMATDGVRCSNASGNSIAVNRARRELN